MTPEKQKDTCMRCGADRKEERRLGGGCSAWGTSYRGHLWGIFTGKTLKVNL